MPKKEEKKQVNKNKTSFFKSFKAELKKVVWPTPKQLVNNTAAVLSIMLITTIIVFILDFTFEGINKYGLDKVKQAVSNSTSNEVSEEETTDDSKAVEEGAEDRTVEEDTTENNTETEEVVEENSAE